MMVLVTPRDPFATRVLGEKKNFEAHKEVDLVGTGLLATAGQFDGHRFSTQLINPAIQGVKLSEFQVRVWTSSARAHNGAVSTVCIVISKPCQLGCSAGGFQD